MRPLNVLRKIVQNSDQDQGFSLLEMVIVTVLVGVLSAIGAPSLVASQRDNEAKEVYSQLRSTLLEAQINANRKSTTCTVTISTSSVTGTPTGCVTENITIDTSIVSLTKTDFATAPTNIAFTYSGTTGNAMTLWIAPKSYSGTVLTDSARCIVVSSTGMIRTGVNRSSSCYNAMNDKY